MEINQQALLKCLQIAKDLGVPKDQAKRFIECGYIPYPWQWRFHAIAREADLPNGPVDIGLGGARGPGKSHAVLSQAGLDDCQRIPRLKGLFLRQTGIAAQESFDDLVEKVIRGHVPHKKTGSVLRFPNGSRILLGGFQDEKDIDKYIGIEYDFIIVEEQNQLTEDKYTKLRGSLRTSKPNWRPRMYTSFNPGGIGHQFVKDRYVEPHRQNKEKEVRFIPSNYKENPNLNKEYIEYLEGLTGDLGKAWREGDFDIFAGQFFREFRQSLHVVRPFMPKKDNLIVGGMDWGRTAPFACELSTIEKVFFEERSFYRTKTFCEIYGTDKTPKEWAIEIINKLKFFDLSVSDVMWIRGDPAMFTKGQDNSISIADQFKENTITIQPASNDRIGGWENIHKWLSIAPDGKPYWQITENCINLIRTLPALIYDENHVEDVDTDGEDHAPDAIRYMFKHLKWIDGKTGQINKKIEIPVGNAGKFFGSNETAQKGLVDLNKFK